MLEQQHAEAPARVDPASQQRNHLCGPFCAARMLREAGFSVDEDELARRAGTVLPDRPVVGTVPPGAADFAEYPSGLATGPPSASGTAAEPLARAIETCSDGALRCVGLHGSWTAASVELVVSEARELGARLLANLRTGLLWGSRPPASALLAQLEHGSGPALAADWDVGHFVALETLVRGPGGALVVVRDTYPTLGFGGYHLQPPAALAAALERGDGLAGGVLVTAAPERIPAIEALGRRAGLQNGMWDNGTRS